MGRYFSRQSAAILIHLEIAICNNVLFCENWDPETVSLALSVVYSHCSDFSDFHLYFLD